MKIFDWLQERSSGIFCHVSSLPSEQGIGCFDANCKLFLQTLAKSGIKYWQICPLHPTIYRDSPYQGTSVFAGNSYFIDLQQFVDSELLTDDDLSEIKNLPQEHVDFGKVYQIFPKVLFKAFRNFKPSAEYNLFLQQESYWLDDYAVFMSLKEHFDNQSWDQWPSKFKDYQTAKQNLHIITGLETQILYHKFVQFIFQKQWHEIKNFASSLGIKIIGDMPIFVGYDGADVWSQTEIFQLNNKLTPEFVAGVPPDAFSPTGQLWGNPVFDWGKLKQTDYQWWVDRIKRASELYDVIRLDHFRGFYDYWAIHSEETTAINGTWEIGGGLDFFTAISKKYKHIQFIAEDLGILSFGAENLLSQTHLPGMKVLHFAFDGNKNNSYLPYNHISNSVLYVGTHDNNTTKAWYQNDLTDQQRNQVRNYLRVGGEDISWDMIRSGFESSSNLFIMTIQDLLSLDKSGRFNTPGSICNNWTWRLTPTQFDELCNSWISPYLKQLCSTYGR